VAPHGYFELAAFGELLQSISTHRVEEPIAYGYATDSPRDERLRHQVRKAIDDIQRSAFGSRRDCVRCFQTEASGKDR